MDESDGSLSGDTAHSLQPSPAKDVSRSSLIPLQPIRLRERPPACLPTSRREFLVKHGAKLKPRTLEEYRRHTRLYLVPAFGKRSIDAISKADVTTAHASWNENPRAANHALAILSKMMSWAEDQGYRPDDTNPCRRIAKYKEAQRERFLSEIELQRLGLAIEQAERDGLIGPYQAAAIRLLILTGARLSEILTLKWEYVDLERQLLLLPDSKTGKKAIPLNEPAASLLITPCRASAGNPYVIVGHKEKPRILSICRSPGVLLRTLADLEGVRLHDLRHTFASWAVAGGASLPVIGKGIGALPGVDNPTLCSLGRMPRFGTCWTQSTGQRIDSLSTLAKVTIQNRLTR